MGVDGKFDLRVVDLSFFLEVVGEFLLFSFGEEGCFEEGFFIEEFEVVFL